MFSICRCEISLQKKLIGEAKAMSKNNARNLAAADALFKLYETQDVIKVGIIHLSFYNRKVGRQ
jgi:hypothetical protein